VLRAGAAETRSTWIASPSAMPSSGTKVGASFEPWHERPSTAREAVSRPAQSKQCLLNVRRLLWVFRRDRSCAPLRVATVPVCLGGRAP
jgi:hypothetical protein